MGITFCDTQQESKWRGRERIKGGQALRQPRIATEHDGTTRITKWMELRPQIRIFGVFLVDLLFRPILCHRGNTRSFGVFEAPGYGWGETGRE